MGGSACVAVLLRAELLLHTRFRLQPSDFEMVQR